MDSDPVPPSSPPHATLTRGLGSPFFERFEQHDDAFSPKSSSPPPLFSSDDSRESADLGNYESPRIFKNKRKGAWWDTPESAHSTPNFKKAKMTRNYDSGVYMMSDGTDSSESPLPEHKPPFGLDGTHDVPSEDFAQRRLLGEEEESFCKELYAGLERESLVYDFSHSHLQDSDIRSIGQLASVIKNIPDPGNEVPAEGQYRSMVPNLYVNLSHNRLHRLTPSLFEVQNLTTLVLTGNNIEELPTQICNLRNLRELNISLNKMRWLPFEFLDFYSDPTQTLILGDSGVPWLMPDDQRIYKWWDSSTREPIDSPAANQENAVDLASNRLHRQLLAPRPDRDLFIWCLRSREALGQWHNAEMVDKSFGHHRTRGLPMGLHPDPLYLARTQVSYFDETSALLKGSANLPLPGDDDFAVLTDTIFGTHGIPASNWFAPPEPLAVTSLLTMSLHNALRYRQEEDLSIDHLRTHIGDPIPLAANAILKQAEKNDSGGYGDFKKCNVCNRDYVVARAEWVEWWFITQRLVVMPFKVQVCSWRCVPDFMLKKPEEFTWE